MVMVSGGSTGRRGFVRRMGILMTALTMSTVAAVTVGATPAAAHVATGQWRTNHTICDGCSVSTGNIVKMWQGILRSAFGDLGSCQSFVDGDFGPNTAAATRRWQSQRGLQDDGMVGPNTWEKAQSLLAFHASQAGYDFYRYHAGQHSMWFRREWGTGIWEFQFGVASGCANSHLWHFASH